jgi:HAD superfamily hydrolase (TIGR01549 family)
MPRTHAIKAVLLDWDGTLLDSFEADTAAYLEMFRKMGIAWGREELALHYSPDWYRVYRAARLERARWEEADRAWRAAYERHRPRLVAGARGVLRRLGARYSLGLVTSGDCGRVVPQLRRFRLVSTFAARVCQHGGLRRKPHPEPLLTALAEMGVEPRAAVYVGDAPEDIEMARRARVRAIGVLGSFPTARRLRASRPEALLDSLLELPGLIEEWSGGPSKRG